MDNTSTLPYGNNNLETKIDTLNDWSKTIYLCLTKLKVQAPFQKDSDILFYYSISLIISQQTFNIARACLSYSCNLTETSNICCKCVRQTYTARINCM